MVRTDVTKLLMTVQVRNEEDLEQAEAPPQLENVQYQHADYDEALGVSDEAGVVDAGEKGQTLVNHGPKVGRNDPCPCGSGKKYKHCHGKLS